MSGLLRLLVFGSVVDSVVVDVESKEMVFLLMADVVIERLAREAKDLKLD